MKNLQLIAAGAAIVMLVYASSLQPSKYVRLKDGCWAHLEHEGERICCGGGTYQSGEGDSGLSGGIEEDLCSTVGVNKVLTSMSGAWLIPMIPWLFGVIVGLAQGDKMQYPTIRRLSLYFAMIAFRTVGLFITFESIMVSFQPTHRACWYYQERKSGKCSRFEPSDHVVLFICHFVCVVLFEFRAVIIESGAKSKRFIAVLLPGAVVIGLAVYNMWFTMLYFHTPKECVVGLALVLVFVQIPLHFLQDGLFDDMVVGSSMEESMTLKTYVDFPAPAAAPVTKSAPVTKQKKDE